MASFDPPDPSTAVTGTDASDSALSPAQSALRLTIELAALGCWGIVGWSLADGPWRFVLAALLPVSAAVIWASFRVPGDASAGQDAPVTVSGIVRLFIELDVLLGAAVFTILVDRPTVGGLLFVAVGIHYALTWRRVRWLLAQRPSGRDLGLP